MSLGLFDGVEASVVPTGLHPVPVEELLPRVRDARLVIADPPWPECQGGGGKGANDRYQLLKWPVIADHLDRVARCMHPDAYLALWRVFPKDEQWTVWWHANRKVPYRYISGGPWMRAGISTGYHWRGKGEMVRIYGRPNGKPKPVRKRAQPPVDRSPFPLPQQGHTSGHRFPHSVKPLLWQLDWVRGWTQPGDLVLDMYGGRGARVLQHEVEALGRRYVGAEPNPQRRAEAVQWLERHLAASP